MLPRTPTFDELARSAWEDHDPDAAFQLAWRAPDRNFTAWVSRWVPADAMTPEVFDLCADAYWLMELDRTVSKKGS